MARIRRPLFHQLLKAWESAIDEDYCNQRINSERSLQASFWSQLNQVLPARTRRMFIEPRVVFATDQPQSLCYPDIAICNTREVIAVVEIKYQPRTRPSYDGDLQKLRLMAERRAELQISNARFRGPVVDARQYPFSKNVLFVWAGVHRKPKESFESPHVPMLSEGFAEMAGCFVQLHAETDYNEHPKVFARRS